VHTLVATGGRLACVALVALVAAVCAKPARASTHGAWKPAEWVAAPEFQGEAPSTTVDAAGTAVAVWRGTSGGSRTGVFEAERPLGGLWTGPVELSAPGDVGVPQVASNSSGAASVVWTWSSGERGSSNVVQSVERTAAGTWTSPVDVSELGQEVLTPRVGIDGHGAAVAVWQTSSIIGGISADPTVQAAVELHGQWSAPTTISAAEEWAEEPTLSLAPGGHAVAMWREYTGTAFNLRGADLVARKRWKASISLSTIRAGAAYGAIAQAKTGEVVVAFRGTRNSRVVTEITVRPPGQSWQEPIDLSAEGEEIEFTPQVTVDAKGEIFAWWIGITGARSDALVVRSKAREQAWSALIALSAPELLVERASVQVDSRGDAFAAWEANARETRTVQAAVQPVGDPWSAPSTLSVSSTNYLDPALGVGPHDGTLVVWNLAGSEGERLQSADYVAD
jgi:hypothetical protein